MYKGSGALEPNYIYKKNSKREAKPCAWTVKTDVKKKKLNLGEKEAAEQKRDPKKQTCEVLGSLLESYRIKL